MNHPSIIRPTGPWPVYSPQKMGKSTIFESPRLLVGLNAFEPGQEHALHAHAGQDKVYLVVEGSGVFLLDGRELPMRPGDLLVAPDGVAHGVRNTGAGRLLVLAILAPAPHQLAMARVIEDEALSGVTKWTRIALLAGLAIWTWQFARTPISPDAMDSWLHLPDLIFHEAGHFIFAMFGRFMTVLGGSLLQFLIPVIAAIAFLRQDPPERFGAAICAWWAGQNLVDLAPYIADSRALQTRAARREDRRRGRRPRLGVHPHAAGHRPSRSVDRPVGACASAS